MARRGADPLLGASDSRRHRAASQRAAIPAGSTTRAASPAGTGRSPAKACAAILAAALGGAVRGAVIGRPAPGVHAVGPAAGRDQVLVGGRSAAAEGRSQEGRADARGPFLCGVVRLGQARRGAGGRMSCSRAGRVRGVVERQRRCDGGTVGDRRDDATAGSGLRRSPVLLRLVLAREHRPEPGTAQGARLRDSGRACS
jgi:hypothetical protein